MKKLAIALCTGQAHAQQCLPKMQGIEVRANLADGFKPGGNDGGYSFGAARPPACLPTSCGS